jgi:hypothetical protein
MNEVRELEVTWARAVVVWWSLVWRFLLASAVAGSALGTFGGFVCFLAGREDWVEPVATLIGIAVSAVVSLWAVRKVLRLRFRGFAIRLVPHPTTGLEP